LRIVRRIAVFLLIVAPIGFVVGINEAGAANPQPALALSITSPVTVGTPITGYTVTVTGGDTPAGVLTLYSYGSSSTCAGPATPTGTAVDATGAPTPSGTLLDTAAYSLNLDADSPIAFQTNSIATPSAGTFYVQAYYSGDATDVTSESACTPVTVNKATTGLTTTDGALTVAAGATISDTANLSGGIDYLGTGSITFTLQDGACPGPGATADTATDIDVDSNGPYTESALSADAPGTYSIIASYTGDGNNSGSTATCEGPITVTLATAVITTNATSTVSVLSPMSDTVTLTGVSGSNATGNVTVTAQLGACSGGPFSDTENVSTATFSGTNDSVATLTVSFTPTTAGTYYWGVTYAGDANNNPSSEACNTGTADETTVVNALTNLTITTASPLPEGAQGVPYTTTLNATGGEPPYTWSTVTSNLPSTLTLGSNGVISGTPSASGTFSIEAEVTDSQLPTHETTTKTFSLTIGGPIAITTTSPLPNTTVGTPYTEILSATGGVGPPYSWSWSGSTPPGLGISTGGTISGTATVPGIYSFQVTVTDADSNTVTDTFVLDVASPLSITANTLPGANHGRSYSAKVTTTGGLGALHFTSTKLPPGLGINSTTGVISGTAGASGSYTFTVTVTDSSSPNPQSVQRTYTLKIS
jgi:hypothetical protein